MDTVRESARVYIHTFGCQMNDLDTEKMYALLVGDGFERVDDIDSADVILVNTCSVRQKAVQKLYSLLGRLRQREGVTVGVTGCVAQQEGRRLTRRFPFIDLVMGPDAIPRVAALTHRALSTQSFVVDVDVHDGLEYPFVSELPEEVGGRVAAFVTIQKGCDNHCAYCVVPQTRGSEASRPSEQVLAEVRSLAARGVREVTLLGQNVNSYGCKSTGEITFPELLAKVHEIEGIRRIRFTTSHPKDLSLDLIEALATLPRVCPYIHLPVQAGANRILKRMHRGYSRERYLERVAALRSSVPGISISTDFIVGFPGETEEEFEQTLSLLSEVQFDASFSFIYSPRPGTASLRLDDEVPLEARKRRLAELQRLQKQISLMKHEALVGSTQTVLVEGPSKNSPDILSGRTPGNKTANFRCSRSRLGEEVSVHIVAASVNSLRGEQVSR